MSDWPHQIKAVADIAEAHNGGGRRIVVTSPTGGGKSRIMQRLIEWGWTVVVYVNRSALLEQLSRGLTEAGIAHGIMAAGYAEETQHKVQIAMIQTVESRWSKGRWHLHPAQLVMVDEAHNEKGARMREVLDAHTQAGATVVGFTATPVGIGDIYEELIQAGTTRELRGCGSLLLAYTFAPDEPSAKAFKSKVKGMMQYQDEYREVMLHATMGRVLEHYRRLNPDGKPAILFAPGVQESQWYAEKLTHAGIRAAHIDGEKIWFDGTAYKADHANRDRLRKWSETGEAEVVCNRFVMREGVDYPWLAHGIFACTFGGICGYLQSGGRILRNHHTLESVTIQDHGGNYWRHDSLNVDREWSLDDTEAKIQEKHDSELREKKEPEPIVCPECSKVRVTGVTCPDCGHTYKGRKRMVVETDGTLREVRGDVFKPRKVSTTPAEEKAWISCVHRGKNCGMSWRQVNALYMRENNWQIPAPHFKFMPKTNADKFRKVKDLFFNHQKETTSGIL